MSDNPEYDDPIVESDGEAELNPTVKTMENKIREICNTLPGTGINFHLPQGRFSNNGKPRLVRLLIASGEMKGRLLDNYRNVPDDMPPYNVYDRVSSENSNVVTGSTCNVQLEFGDFMFVTADTFQPVLCIERKTVSDMFSSIIDGRIFSQKIRMLASGLRPQQCAVLIVIKSLQEWFDTGNVATTVRKYCATLAIADGITVDLCTEDTLPLYLVEKDEWLNQPKRFAGSHPQIQPRLDAQTTFFNQMYDVMQRFYSLAEPYETDILESFMSLLPEQLHEHWKLAGGATIGLSLPSGERRKQLSESVNILGTIKGTKAANLMDTQTMTGAMLINFAGVSADKAKLIAEVLPTMSHIVAAYEKLPSHELRCNLMAKLAPGLGPKRSEVIYNHVVPEQTRNMYLDRDVKNETSLPDGKRKRTKVAVENETKIWKSIETKSFYSITTNTSVRNEPQNKSNKRTKMFVSDFDD